ncbi:MAG: hypothetical protein ACLP22_18085 [Solirubrobacteraceae bacterium]
MSRGLLLTGLITLCLLLAGPVLDAVAGEPIVPIPGLIGGDIQVVGALRTSDGGGILAARISSSSDSAGGQIVVARLLADGALSLAYGSEGLSTLPLDPRLRPTALAVDPATGEAWIGARTGPAGRGEIIALDGDGNRLRSFAKDGVLQLPAAGDGGPVSLAWSPDGLLVAAGEARCRGCALSVRDLATGRPDRSFTLPPADLGPPGCDIAVTAAIFANAKTELLTTRTAARRGCTSRILTLGRNLKPIGPYGAKAPPPVPGSLASTSLIVTSGGASCVAATTRSQIGISSYPSRSAPAVTPAPAGTLIALVPLGPGACAALIRTARGDATVAQMSAGNRRALSDRLPAAVAPLAMFRCNEHLLVVGTTSSAGQQYAMITPVAVGRGKFQGRVGIASVQPPTTGCR